MNVRSDWRYTSAFRIGLGSVFYGGKVDDDGEEEGAADSEARDREFWLYAGLDTDHLSQSCCGKRVFEGFRLEEGA